MRCLQHAAAYIGHSSNTCSTVWTHLPHGQAICSGVWSGKKRGDPCKLSGEKKSFRIHESALKGADVDVHE